MAAAKLKLTIDQGASFTKLFTWKAGPAQTPVDLTGCTARMQIRKEIATPAAKVEQSRLRRPVSAVTYGGI